MSLLVSYWGSSSLTLTGVALEWDSCSDHLRDRAAHACAAHGRAVRRERIPSTARLTASSFASPNSRGGYERSPKLPCCCTCEERIHTRFIFRDAFCSLECAVSSETMPTRSRSAEGFAMKVSLPPANDPSTAGRTKASVSSQSPVCSERVATSDATATPGGTTATRSQSLGFADRL